MRTCKMLAYSISIVLGVLSAPVIAQSRPENENFDPAAVVKGFEIGRDQCDLLARNDTAVWVEIHGRSACMRVLLSRI